MRSTLLLLSTLAVIACGGASAIPAEPIANSGVAVTTGTTRLTFFTLGQLTAELLLHPDGTIVARGDEQGRRRLAGDELMLDGKVVARRDAVGRIIVRQWRREMIDGHVANDEESWVTIGLLDEAGVFRADEHFDEHRIVGGRELRIVDGQVVGLPPQVRVDVELADPAAVRDALFVVAANFTAGGSTSWIYRAKKPKP